MAVSRFEDLIAWQRARALCNSVYEATATGGFPRDTGLQGQVRRAAVSIMANIAEGFARGSGVEFRRYLDIAIGSNAEALSHLYVAMDVGCLNSLAFDALKTQSDEVARILRGLKSSIDAGKQPAGQHLTKSAADLRTDRRLTTTYDLRTTNS